MDPLACLRIGVAVLAQVLRDLVAGEHSLGDLIEHRRVWNIARSAIRERPRVSRTSCSLQPEPDVSIARHTASANPLVEAVPPRSRVVDCPLASTWPSADMMRSAALSSPM